MSEATTGKGRARGIDRIIGLCDCLHRVGRPVSVRELVELTQAPRSSVYEQVATLLEAGWLEERTDGLLFFGRKMHYFGTDYLRHDDFIARARRVLVELTAEHAETSQLCMLEGDKYVVALSEMPPRPFAISSEVGMATPIPWTASGRVLLEGYDAAALHAFVPEEDFILPSGERIQPADFAADISRAASQGYAVTRGLVDGFACCIAVPIRDLRGKVKATICFTVGNDIDDQRLAMLVEVLSEAGRRLSEVSVSGAR
ncbi:IclR family transcriptional regulator [Halotalea alkalilenta]|uniref:IclR family transcriptional regulator n=1 Tax=Halotalea alkalilenta TaxID=376489 RepID=UPI000480A7BB|nr:IclR family transcriptional regulator [Halotalea alkalilenta]